MKETLSSISERIGYSKTTISRVLSGKSDKYRISPATAKIILDEVQRCGYTAPAIAQTLRNKRTRTIGLMMPSSSNPYFARISSFLIEEANKNGYTSIVIDTMENAEEQERGINTLLSKSVDGIIVSPCDENPVFLERINRESTKVVLVDRYYSETTLPYVTTNNFIGGYKATKLLCKNGHRKIACIQGMKDSMPNRKRVEGFLAAVNETEGCTGYIAGNEFSIQNGYLSTKILLNEVPDTTAIFVLSNMILLGVLKALREENIRIPEDISIISYDDSPYLDYLTPPITRVSQPVESMSRLAAKMLFNNIENQDQLTNSIQLTPTIIHRDSVAEINA